MTAITAIQMNDISKTFADNTVLKKINLEVPRGEIFGLLGPSGAGKTTIINLLTGQLRPSSGKAGILGSDTGRIPPEIYARIGMVLDNTGLYERLSCYDNLSLFADIYRIGKAGIRKALEQVGLGDALKRPVSKLSKGMKQRLILARAIMHNPALLFLDEPTSGLDPQTANQIHQLILDQTAKGMTVFLTTHNMEEATKLCNTVALLNNGEIVEYGSPGDICRKYNHQNMIEVLLKNGELKTIKNDCAAGELLSEYFQAGQVVSIHSTEPNLETVFMELTGRRLADETI